MPFPVVAHQGLAAPALLARRWRLNGVALLAGSVAPDLPYALDRTRLDVDAGSHSWAALVWLCIPVAVVAGWAFRAIVAGPLAAHVPDLGPLRLRDMASAVSDWHPFATTAVSAMLGGLTHLMADGFTHPEPWAMDLAPWLAHRADGAPGFVGPDYRATYWYDVVGAVATASGIVLVVVCLALSARRRARENVPRPSLPATTRRSHLMLWGTSVAGVVVGLLLAAVVWGPETRAQGTMLATLAVATALTVGCHLATTELRHRPAFEPPARSAP